MGFNYFNQFSIIPIFYISYLYRTWTSGTRLDFKLDLLGSFDSTALSLLRSLYNLTQHLYFVIFNSFFNHLRFSFTFLGFCCFELSFYLASCNHNFLRFFFWNCILLLYYYCCYYRNIRKCHQSQTLAAHFVF